MAIASFRAGGSIAAGDAVYVNTAGFLHKAIGSQLSNSIAAGIALDSGNEGSLIRVDTDGLYARASLLNPGEDLYLSPVISGSLVAASGFYQQLDNSILGSAYLAKFGRATSTSGFTVELEPPIFINPSGFQ